MKLNKVLLGLSLAISPFYGLMAEPAPVIDISNDSSGNLITAASSHFISKRTIDKKWETKLSTIITLISLPPSTQIIPTKPIF